MLAQELELDKVKVELKGEVCPKAVDFVFHFLQMFSSYCQATDTKCTTQTLVANAPYMIVSLSGHLAELYLDNIKLLTYQQIGLILDTMVSYELFKYQESDSLEHFQVERSLRDDIKYCLDNFSGLFEKNQRGLINVKYANSGRT